MKIEACADFWEDQSVRINYVREVQSCAIHNILVNSFFRFPFVEYIIIYYIILLYVAICALGCVWFDGNNKQINKIK